MADARALQRKYWCFTLNNPSEKKISPASFQAKLQQLHDDGRITYAVFQQERGKQDKTVHFQGYIQLTKKGRLTWLKANIDPTAHWEACNGSIQDNIDYCTKDDTREAGPWHVGEVQAKGKGRRTDYEKAYKLLETHERVDSKLIAEMKETAPNLLFNNWRNIQAVHSALHPPRDRGPVEIITIIGNTGTGKSTIVSDSTTDHTTGVCSAYKPNMAGNGKIWFDGYNGQKDLWFEDMRDNSISVQDFLNIFDTQGRALQLPVKGGHVNAEFTRIWITSNELPNTWFTAMHKAQETNNWKAIARRLGCQADDSTKAHTPNYIFIGADGTREQLTEAWTNYCDWAELPIAQVRINLFALH